jgi:hypothetical protein
MKFTLEGEVRIIASKIDSDNIKITGKIKNNYYYSKNNIYFTN